MKFFNSISIQSLLEHIFVADAYTMPLQWNYNFEDIDSLIDNGSIDISTFNSGKYSNYFANKEKGQFSHYGDMLLHLYHYVKSNASFKIDEYSTSWQQFVENYDGYKDSTTKSTLQNIQKNVSPYDTVSTDFIGVLCGLPLIILANTNTSEDDVIALIQQRSNMTHNHPLIRDGIQWLIHASMVISQDYTIEQTIEYANSKSNNNDLLELIKKGQTLASTKKDTRLLIKDAGLGCDIQSNLPYCIVLLLREKFDFMHIMKGNIIAGSDSVSRALFLAYLLGSKSHNTVPKNLLSQLEITI